MSRTPQSQRPSRTIGARLEHDRLKHRAHRLEQVVMALRARARDHSTSGGTVPKPLAASLADFQRELAQVRNALGVRSD